MPAANEEAKGATPAETPPGELLPADEQARKMVRRIVRAHARGARSGFLKSCKKLVVYFETGIGGARIASTTCKVMLKVLQPLQLTPSVYGDKAKRIALLRVCKLLMASSTMEQSLFDDLVSLLASRKVKQRAGNASTLDPQRDLQLVYSSSALLVTASRHASIASSEGFQKTLQFLLETSTSLISSAVSKRQAGSSKIGKTAVRALTTCFRQCTWKPSRRNPKKNIEKGAAVEKDDFSASVLEVCAADFSNRFAGVQAVLSSYSEGSVPDALRRQAVDLFCSQVLSGPGATSQAMISVFAESGVFSFITPEDMNSEGKVYASWSTSLKRRAAILIPLALTRFFEGTNIDLSESAVSLFFPPIHDYCLTKVSGRYPDDPGHVAALKCVSLLLQRISDSGAFTDILSKVKEIAAGGANMNGVVVRNWPQRAALLSVIESLHTACKKKGAHFAARLSQLAIETLFIVYDKATDFEVKRNCFVLAGKWLGSLSGSFVEAEAAKSKALTNLAKVAGSQPTEFNSNVEDAQHAAALCYHSCFSMSAANQGSFSSEVLSSVWAGEETSRQLISGLSALVDFASEYPLLQDNGSLDASLQASWMLLALKGAVGAGDRKDHFQTIQRDVTDPSSFVYRPFHVAGASEEAELAALRLIEISTVEHGSEGDLGEFFSKWTIPKVKNSKANTSSTTDTSASINDGKKRPLSDNVQKAATKSKAKLGKSKGKQGKKQKKAKPKFAGFAGMKRMKPKDKSVAAVSEGNQTNRKTASSGASPSLNSEAMKAAAVTSASNSFGFHSHPCLLGLLCALSSPLRPKIRTSSTHILCRIGSKNPNFCLNMLQALCKDLHENAKSSQKRFRARSILEQKLSRKRSDDLAAFWRTFLGIDSASQNVGNGETDLSQEQERYSPKFVMSTSYTHVLHTLAHPQLIGTCDSLADVIAHLHFLSHHPIVSPQRANGVGLIECSHPGTFVLPRCDTKTAWNSVSKRLIESMPAATEQIQIVDVGETDEKTNYDSSQERLAPSPLRYRGVIEAVINLCVSPQYGCFAKPEVTSMGRCALRSLVSLTLAKESSTTLSPVVTKIVSGLTTSVEELSQFNDEECAIYNTPESVLYISAEEAHRNKQSIEVDRDGEPLNKKLISASKAGLSGRQAMEWDLRVRKEMAALKAIATADKNSPEYISRMSRQADIRERINIHAGVANTYLSAIDVLSRAHPAAMRVWQPQLLPVIQKALQQCMSIIGPCSRRALEALCACCPYPLSREAIRLARLYHVMKSDPPSSTCKEYEGSVRSIVEIVHAAVISGEVVKEEESEGELEKENSNLLTYSLHALIPILVSIVKAANHIQDKGLVIGCLQIMQQHAVSLPDMPPPHEQAFWRHIHVNESSSDILSPLPVPIRPLRASMMSAALYMQKIAANAAGGLPGALLQDLCAGPAPLSPSEWSVLSSDEGLLSSSLQVRKCGIECLALLEPCNGETLEQTYGEEFALRLWLLQHDDALEDDANDVWNECFSDGTDDATAALPENFAQPLMVLMDHASAHVREMASFAVASALEVYPDSASDTVNKLTDLFKQKTQGKNEGSEGAFYSSRTLTSEEKQERDSLCRVEVARALGEISEIGVLTETEVQEVFSFLLHFGLTDDDERVQQEATEAGISFCNSYGKTMNEQLIPMFEDAMREADAGEAAAETERRAKAKAKKDMSSKSKKGKNKIAQDGARKGKMMIASADFVNSDNRNSNQGKEDSAEMTAIKFDRMRKGVVLFMGTTGRFLNPDDARLSPIVMTLVDALKIPSEQVQKTVAKCLSPLMKVMKKGSQFDDGRAIILALIHQCTKGDSYGTRRGAAWGLAGVTKGLGIACLTSQDVVTKLKKAAGSKTLVEARQGALFAFECLASTLGLLFEPFVIGVLEDMLLLIGDKNSDVREAAEDAARIIMGNLTTHGIKLVLPTLIKAFNAVQWRTKRASITMLGSMAHAAPKQLASCLPQVMPKLTESLKDAQSRVRDAGKAALDKIASVIKNPEVVELVPALKTALVKPSDGLQPALEVLEKTDFVNPVDAASLAMIFPIVHRSLRGRSGMHKRKAAQITADMVHMVEDPLDLVPYLRQLVPQLEKLLTDAVPDVRLTSARSLGRLVRGLGEEHFPDTVQTLCTGLFAKSSKVERSGHAQGLCEVLVALGPERLEGCVAELIPQSTHEMGHIREGTMWLLAFLPATMGTHFSKLIPTSLPVILKGLADEVDGVREVSMRAGQIVIAQHGNSDTNFVLPSLEEAMFDADWRIRQMVGQLLGDLLQQLGGGKLSYNEAVAEAEKLGNDPNFKEDEEVEETPEEKRRRRRLARRGGNPGSSKQETSMREESDDDTDDDSEDDSDDGSDDDDTLSSAASGSSRSMSSMALLRNIESKVGKETMLRLFAKLYMLRADANLQVKQQAGNVWKGLITNTGRMLRAMLVQFMASVIEFLASPRDELQIIAGGSLGDIVRKLGDRVTTIILPILKQGIDPKDNSDAKRQGTCLGMLEVIRASSRRLLERTVVTLMPIIQTALCDPAEEICEIAAQCFNVMQNKLGGNIIDSVVPQLLKDLKHGDKATSEASLQGLCQILSLRGKEVLHALMPKLISKPDSDSSHTSNDALEGGIVNLFQAKTLASICVTTGGILHLHIDVLMNALTNTLAQCQMKLEFIDNLSEEHKAEVINLEAAVKSAMRTIIINVEDEGVQWTMTEFVHAATVSKYHTVRAASVWCLGEFCEHSELDFSSFNASIAVALLDRLFDTNETVLLAANSSLHQLNKRMSAEVLVNDLKEIRQAINSGVSRAQGIYRKKNSEVADAEQKSSDPPILRGSPYYVPGFCIKKGLAPVLPVFLQGLIYGNVEQRESSAAGLGEIITVSTDIALKPFLNKIVGPLIRVIGDKFPAPVKIETLKTIILAISKGGRRIRPFIPQLQTTFVKNLSDASHMVRNLSAKALRLLMEFISRVDQLATELKNGITGSIGGVQHAMMNACHGVLATKGEKISINVLIDLKNLFIPRLIDATAEARYGAAKCLGVLAHLLDSEQGASVINNTLCGTKSMSSWEYKYTSLVGLSAFLDTDVAKPGEGLLSADEKTSETVLKTIQTLAKDDNGSVREASCIAAGSLVLLHNKDFKAVALMGTKLLVNATKDKSSDVRTAACEAVKMITKQQGASFWNEGFSEVREALVVAIFECAMERKNVRLRTAADQSILYALRLFEGNSYAEEAEQSIFKSSDRALRSFFPKHWAKVQRTVSRDKD